MHMCPLITSSLGISRWKNIAQIHDCGIRAAIPYQGIMYWDYNWRKGGGSSRMIEISKREDFTSRNTADAFTRCAITPAIRARRGVFASISA